MTEPSTSPEKDSRPPSAQSSTFPPPLSPAPPEADPSPPPTIAPDLRATLSEESSAPAEPSYQSFARYVQLEQLLPSGMGAVFKAWDPVLKMHVALKTVHSIPPNADSVMEARFKRETLALARLSHPHIVRIYDVGRHDGRAYFTMSFMSGGSLDSHTLEYRDARTAASLMEKVARAMHYVHEHGILHRDLKPANILLDENGEPRVSDFGLAKFLDDETEITRTGAVMGTLPYMAPEQARGQVDRFSPATDVWALGVILYELLIGRRPFETRARETIAPMICSAEPPRPRTLRPDLDGALQTIILKCLEKKPEDRFPTALALAEDLKRWLAGSRILTRPPSIRVRFSRFVRRHPAASTATALLAGFLVLLLFLLPGANKVADLAKEPAPQQTQKQTREPVQDQEMPRLTAQEIMERVRTELARGEAAQFIPPHGLPDWWNRRAATKMHFLRDGSSEKRVTLNSYEPVALDLLPESPCDRYRLRAEVCVHKQARGGSGGIYIGAIEHPGAEGLQYHWWISLSFPCNDTNSALQLQRYRRPLKGYDRGKQPLLRQNLLRAPDPGDGLALEWRQLQLDVTERDVVAYVDGDPIGAVTAAQLDEHLKLIQPKAFASVLLRGGLGLYNEDAETLFRRVAVESLP